MKIDVKKQDKWNVFICLLLILTVAAFVALFYGLIEVSEFLMFLILAATAWVIWEYTRAAQKSNEIQLKPSVDVNMIYDKIKGGTRFWFRNYSNDPVYVVLKLETNGNKHIINESKKHFYLSPREPGLMTDTYLNFWSQDPPRNKTTTTLYITAKSAFDDVTAEWSFLKNYEFHGEKSRWDEKTWGNPDRDFPQETDAVMVTKALDRIRKEILNLKTKDFLKK